VEVLISVILLCIDVQPAVFGCGRVAECLAPRNMVDRDEFGEDSPDESKGASHGRGLTENVGRALAENVGRLHVGLRRLPLTPRKNVNPFTAGTPGSLAASPAASPGKLLGLVG
jgi:hypothetical protein